MPLDLQSLLNNESMTDIVTVVTSFLLFSHRFANQDGITITAASINSNRKKASYTLEIRPPQPGRTLYNFNAFSEVRFSLSKGKPKNVFVMYSKNDSVVSSSVDPETVEIHRLKEKAKIGNQYIYEFDKEYIYSSFDPNKFKPFLLFIETRRNLLMCYIIMQQQYQGITSTDTKSGMSWSRPNPVIQFDAKYAKIFLDNQRDKIEKEFANNLEIAETLNIADAVKQDIDLHVKSSK